MESWNSKGARASAVIYSPSKNRSAFAVRLEFDSTNNVAEYEAIVLVLRKLKAMGVRRAVLKSDSQVIVGHVDKSYKAREPTLEKYLHTIRRMESHFEGFEVRNIPRSANDEADTLARTAAEGQHMLQKYFLKYFGPHQSNFKHRLYYQFPRSIATTGEARSLPS